MFIVHIHGSLELTTVIQHHPGSPDITGDPSGWFNADLFRGTQFSFDFSQNTDATGRDVGINLPAISDGDIVFPKVDLALNRAVDGDVFFAGNISGNDNGFTDDGGVFAV